MLAYPAVKKGKKLDCHHFYEIQHCLSHLPQHSQVLYEKPLVHQSLVAKVPRPKSVTDHAKYL